MAHFINEDIRIEIKEDYETINKKMDRKDENSQSKTLGYSQASILNSRLI
jgi:hypothetical protein